MISKKQFFFAVLALFFLFGCASTPNQQNISNSSASGNSSTAGESSNVDISAGVGLMKDVVQAGDTIKVDYTGTFEDGNKFDSSLDRGEPLEFVVGAGQMIKGFDAAVVGMNLNEEKNISLAPKDAYGEKDESRIQQVPKQNLLDADIVPEAGMTLFANGQEVLITAVDENTVTIDFNSKMAGKTLNFWLKVVGITKKQA